MKQPDVQHIVKRLFVLQDIILQQITIERVIALPKGNSHHYENDAEHSYSLAMLAWYLSQYVPELDKSKLIQYALAHDVVEIYAGDVMAIGRTEAAQKEKDRKERAAIERLASKWPDFTDMGSALNAYQDMSDDEAVFVRTLDKIASTFVNIRAAGRIWKEEGITRQETFDNKDTKAKAHELIDQIWQELRKELLVHDEYFS